MVVQPLLRLSFPFWFEKDLVLVAIHRLACLSLSDLIFRLFRSDYHVKLTSRNELVKYSLKISFSRCFHVVQSRTATTMHVWVWAPTISIPAGFVFPFYMVINVYTQLLHPRKLIRNHCYSIRLAKQPSMRYNTAISRALTLPIFFLFVDDFTSFCSCAHFTSLLYNSVFDGCWLLVLLLWSFHFTFHSFVCERKQSPYRVCQISYEFSIFTITDRSFRIIFPFTRLRILFCFLFASFCLLLLVNQAYRITCDIHKNTNLKQYPASSAFQIVVLLLAFVLVEITVKWEIIIIAMIVVVECDSHRCIFG